MVRRQHPQRLFEPLLPGGEKPWDATQRRIDEALEDEELIDQVEEALSRRRPKSRAGDALAYRLRRPHQRPQAPARALPLSRATRHGPLGGIGSHGQQSAAAETERIDARGPPPHGRDKGRKETEE